MNGLPGKRGTLNPIHQIKLYFLSLHNLALSSCCAEYFYFSFQTAGTCLTRFQNFLKQGNSILQLQLKCCWKSHVFLQSLRAKSLLYQLNIPGSVQSTRILSNMEKQEFTGEKNISKFIAQTFGSLVFPKKTNYLILQFTN